MKTEVNEDCTKYQGEATSQSDAGFRFSSRLGIERVFGFERVVGDCQRKARVVALADHQEKALVHLRHSLVIRFHSYSTKVAVN